MNEEELDGKIDDLLSHINDISIDYDEYEFGVPVYDMNVRTPLRDAVKKFLLGIPTPYEPKKDKVVDNLMSGVIMSSEYNSDGACLTKEFVKLVADQVVGTYLYIGDDPVAECTDVGYQELGEDFKLFVRYDARSHKFNRDKLVDMSKHAAYLLPFFTMSGAVKFDSAELVSEKPTPSATRFDFFIDDVR